MAAGTVLVTGANAGLGLATCLELARRGFSVVGTVRSDEKAELVQRAAAAADLDVATRLLDIDDAERCAAVIDEVRPWGLVNNAGIVDQRRVEEMSDDDARALLETLLVAPIRLSRLCLPHMREQGSGRIVQVSSSSGRVTFPLLGWYQGAKHGLEAVSDALRMEVAADGIHVSLVEPGVFGDLGNDTAGEIDRLKWFRLLWSSTEHVADVVAGVFTARVPRARYVVGRDAQLNVVSDRFTPTFVRDRVMRVVYKL
jgi:NAD(P)-dependent dehydrogenase (short-subunit alcohol dehydrogenase family)